MAPRRTRAGMNALGRVVNREPIRPFPEGHGGVRLHRVVGFGRAVIITLDPRGGGGEPGVHVAEIRVHRLVARDLRVRAVGIFFLAEEVDARRLLAVAHLHGFRRVHGLLEGVRQRDTDGLVVIMHGFVAERGDHPAGRTRFVHGVRFLRRLRRVERRLDGDDAGQLQGRLGVHGFDLPAGDRAADQDAVDHARHRDFRGIPGAAGDFEPAVDAVERLADGWGCHEGWIEGLRLKNWGRPRRIFPVSRDAAINFYTVLR